MEKFKVKLIEVNYYEEEVEADDELEAQDEVQDKLENGELEAKDDILCFNGDEDYEVLEQIIGVKADSLIEEGEEKAAGLSKEVENNLDEDEEDIGDEDGEGSKIYDFGDDELPGSIWDSMDYAEEYLERGYEISEKGESGSPNEFNFHYVLKKE